MSRSLVPWLHRAAAMTALLVGSALLAACGESASQGPPTDLQSADPEAKVTLTWWTGQDDSSQVFIDELVKQFEAEHPNVTIDATPGSATTDDLLGQLSAAFAGGTYPDISYAYGSWAAELANSGRTLDITKTVAEDPEVHWDEFSEAARATASPERQDDRVPGGGRQSRGRLQQVAVRCRRSSTSPRPTGPGRTSEPQRRHSLATVSTERTCRSPEGRTPRGDCGLCCGRTAAAS